MSPTVRSIPVVLVAHINAVADTLDGGVLSPPDVRRLPYEAVIRVFAQLTADRTTVIEHWPADPHASPSDGTCPIDGQRLPCATIEHLCGRYGIAPAASYDATRVPRSAWWPTDDQVVHTIRRILAEDS